MKQDIAHKVADRFHWTDTSKEARRARAWLRNDITLGIAPALADERPDAPERFRGEYMTCPICETGPWHITWGSMCPNCSGAD